jgi:two-component system sensor histidine kinase YesM
MLFIYAAYVHSKSVLEKNTWEMSVKILKHNDKEFKKLLDDITVAANTSAADPKALSDLKGTLVKNLNPSLAARLEGAYVVKRDKVVASWQRDEDTPVFNSPSAQSWFVNTAAAPEAAFIHGTNQRFYSKGRNSIVFSIARALGNGRDSLSSSVLLLDFDYRLLQDIMEPVPNPDNSEEIILTDRNNTVMYSTDASSLTIPLDNVISKGTEDQRQGLVPLGTGKSKRLMSYIHSADGHWTFIHIISANAVINRLTPFSTPFVAICIIMCPLLLILYFIVSSMHLNPINDLTAVISGYERSTNPKRISLSDSDNSHGISDSTAGSSEIDYLIKKVYDIRLKQKEAELNSLQNQINPHFLYNTLESIRGAALYNGIHEIAAMSKALSLLFRYSISDKPLVTIREELGHLENYMSIQNFRYENRFELVYNIPPEFYSYQILKLTLQPLIENSIKHGLEMKLGKGIIKIEILSLDKNIKIQVSDNGIGMHSKKIEELNKHLSSNELRKEGSENSDSFSAGIGVRNVNSRIKLYFGEQYGLNFKEAYTGTIVELVLPAVKED